MITRHDTYTQTRSISGETSEKKNNSKIFLLHQKIRHKFEGGVSGTFLSYQVYFRRYQHFRPLWLKISKNPRRQMFATNRFVTRACSWQPVTSRLRSITSWHMFVTVNVSFNAHACHEVHFVAKFMQSRTYVPKSSRHEVTFHQLRRKTNN